MDFETEQAVIARAKRARAEAIDALVSAAAKALRRQRLKLQRVWALPAWVKLRLWRSRGNAL